MPFEAPPIEASGEFDTLCKQTYDLLVAKKLRFCESVWAANAFLDWSTNRLPLKVYYAKLKQIVEPEGRVPDRDAVLNSIGHFKCYSLIMLKDAFNQVELDEESKEKTAFQIPG